jgi:prophage DNA circulation protein
MTGYVLGADYITERDALADALDAAGTGELFHPYFGRFIVQAGTCSMREQSSEGGICMFSLEFIRTDAALNPTAVVNLPDAAFAAADAMKSAGVDSFGAIFDVLSYPAFVLNSARAKVSAFADDLEVLARSILPIESVGEAVRAARRLATEFDDLVTDPSGLAREIQGAIGLAIGDAVRVKSSFANALNLLGIGDDDLIMDTGTPSRTAENQNQAAINSLVKQGLLAELGALASITDFDSRNDALDVRDAILVAIDAELESGVSDDAFSALRGLQAAVADAVPSIDDEPLLKDFIPQQTTSSLVISYRLYADARREAEIVARNGIRHPGFIAGGQPVQVLSNV